jgi:hypothetical protein
MDHRASALDAEQALATRLCGLGAARLLGHSFGYERIAAAVAFVPVDGVAVN